MNKEVLAHSASTEQRFLNKEHSPSDLRLLYLDEYGEYIEARELAILGDEPMNMLSEAGDLAVIHSQLKKKGEIPRDVAILHEEVLEDLSLVGVDIVDCELLKNTRNALKYPGGITTLNGHTQEEYKEISKKMWQYIGDNVFYYAYMMMAEELYPYERERD